MLESQPQHWDCTCGTIAGPGNKLKLKFIVPNGTSEPARITEINQNKVKRRERKNPKCLLELDCRKKSVKAWPAFRTGP